MKIALQIMLMLALAIYLFGGIGEKNLKYKIIYIGAAALLIVAMFCTIALL